jgi:hypothetical protein
VTTSQDARGSSVSSSYWSFTRSADLSDYYTKSTPVSWARQSQEAV